MPPTAAGPARAQALRARLAQRVQTSPHSVRVSYPARAAGMAGSGRQAAAPLSPLHGRPAPEATLVPPDPTTPAGAPVVPTRDPVTVPCLWYDATNAGDLAASGVRAPGGASRFGWVEGAHALALVLADALGPNGDVFRGTDVVQHLVDAVPAAGLDGASRYTVLQVTGVSAGFLAAGSYAVWLTTAGPAGGSAGGAR